MHIYFFISLIVFFIGIFLVCRNFGNMAQNVYDTNYKYGFVSGIKKHLIYGFISLSGAIGMIIFGIIWIIQCFKA